MKRRVMDFARQSRYVPHRASQVLVRNKIRRLALFSSSLPAYFWDEIRKGIEVASDSIRAFDFDVHYHTVPDFDTQDYLSRIRAELQAGLDALAVVNQPIYDMDAIYAELQSSGIPYVTFNADAPGRRGLCYVGADYVAGGRLAAEIIGTAIRYSPDPGVLVIADNTITRQDPAHVNLNAARLSGFREVVRERFPGIRCDVQCVETGLQSNAQNDQIVDLLNAKKGTVNAVYLIPAINPPFLDALEESGYYDTVNVVHDLDTTALHYLDKHLLTAAVHQNPILQGYYAVKVLEYIVESGTREPLRNVEIASNVVFAENKDVTRNHFDFIG